MAANSYPHPLPPLPRGEGNNFPDKSRWLWVLQAVSGVALIVLVGMHWVAQHYLASGGLRTYAQVVAYLQQPVALVLELAFLVVVTAHAMLGVRAIFMDLGLRRVAQRYVDAVLWIGGIGIVLYGVQLTWQVVGG